MSVLAQLARTLVDGLAQVVELSLRGLPDIAQVVPETLLVVVVADRGSLDIVEIAELRRPPIGRRPHQDHRVLVAQRERVRGLASVEIPCAGIEVAVAVEHIVRTIAIQLLCHRVGVASGDRRRRETADETAFGIEDEQRPRFSDIARIGVVLASGHARRAWRPARRPAIGVVRRVADEVLRAGGGAMSEKMDRGHVGVPLHLLQFFVHLLWLRIGLAVQVEQVHLALRIHPVASAKIRASGNIRVLRRIPLLRRRQVCAAFRATVQPREIRVVVADDRCLVFVALAGRDDEPGTEYRHRFQPLPRQIAQRLMRRPTTAGHQEGPVDLGDGDLCVLA